MEIKRCSWYILQMFIEILRLGKVKLNQVLNFWFLSPLSMKGWKKKKTKIRI